jgi:hypothetical protein
MQPVRDMRAHCEQFDSVLAQEQIAPRSFWPASGNRFEIILARVRDHLTHIAFRNDWVEAASGVPVTVCANVVADPAFDAFALRARDAHVVGLSTGCFLELRKRCLAITSMPEFRGVLDSTPIGAALDWFGQHDRIIRDEQDEAAIGTDSLPTRRKDLRAASIIWRMASEFCYLHELHHLVTGHAGFAKTRRGARELPEYRRADWIQPFESRCMEYTADLFASKTMIDNLVNRRFALLLTPEQPLSPDPLLDQSLLFFGYLAVSLLLCEFERAEEGPRLSGEPEHPSAFTRLASVQHFLTHALDRDLPELAEHWIGLENLAYQLLRASYERQNLGVSILAKSRNADESDKAMRENRELLAGSTRMQPEWQKFALDIRTPHQLKA